MASDIWLRTTQIVREEGRKETFYLTTHSTHFIYCYMASDMVKDRSDSEKGNLLPPHGLLFPISSKFFFYMHHPADRIAHTTAFVTPVVEHWLEREIAQWVTMRDRSDDPSHHGATTRSLDGNRCGVYLTLFVSICSFDLSCPILEKR